MITTRERERERERSLSTIEALNVYEKFTENSKTDYLFVSGKIKPRHLACADATTRTAASNLKKKILIIGENIHDS